MSAELVAVGLTVQQALVPIAAIGVAVLSILVLHKTLKWVKHAVTDTDDPCFDQDGDYRWACENCNELNDEGTKHCDHCGTPMDAEGFDYSSLEDHICPSCGIDEVDPDEGHCSHCGCTWGDGS